ncbi:MAG: hypothetical protein IJZ86_01125 [Bacteroides sp.]|nr:hypothetical protein [Bacteroides sp.]
MIRERILALIKELGVSGREFCKIIGQSEGWNRTIGNSIGTDAVVKILTAYPIVNINWLVLGKGEMFLNNTSEVAQENSSNYHFNNNYREINEDLRNDNKVLREENHKLRETLFELMHKNEKLLIENVQLKAKALREQ